MEINQDCDLTPEQEESGRNFTVLVYQEGEDKYINIGSKLKLTNEEMEKVKQELSTK